MQSEVQGKYRGSSVSLVDNLEKYQLEKYKNYQRMTIFCNCFFIIILRERKVSHTLDAFFFQ